MISRKLSALLLVCVLIMLPILLSGCEEVPGSSQPTSSVAVPTQAPTEEHSSKTETEASMDPEPTEAPDNIADFEDVFAQNPIDTKLSEALSVASSSGAILDAYETAGKYWKAMIPLAYDAAKEVVGEEDRAQLEQDQQTWEDTIDDIVSTIQEENNESGDGKIASARMIQERYRETAKALCEIIYAGTGELPDFTPAMSDGPKG